MIGIVESLAIKSKAKNVVSSCITQSHVDSAFRYLELYLNKTKDLLSYYHLRRILIDKEDSIKNQK